MTFDGTALHLDSFAPNPGWVAEVWKQEPHKIKVKFELENSDNRSRIMVWLADGQMKSAIDDADHNWGWGNDKSRHHGGDDEGDDDFGRGAGDSDDKGWGDRDDSGRDHDKDDHDDDRDGDRDRDGNRGGGWGRGDGRSHHDD